MRRLLGGYKSLGTLLIVFLSCTRKHGKGLQTHFTNPRGWTKSTILNFPFMRTAPRIRGADKNDLRLKVPFSVQKRCFESFQTPFPNVRFSSNWSHPQGWWLYRKGLHRQCTALTSNVHSLLRRPRPGKHPEI